LRFYSTFAVLLASLTLNLGVACSWTAVGGDEDMCVRDLQASFALVARNYAGYEDKLRLVGGDAIAQARANALRQVEAATGQSCEEILGEWLATLGDRHIQLVAARRPSNPAVAAPDRSPQFEIVSEDAALIRARSFIPRFREPLEQLVAEHREEILARPELIIDLRGNGGGADATYRVLAELVYSKPVTEIGMDALATLENIAAWEQVLRDINLPPAVQKEFEDRVAAMKQRPGEWVSMGEDLVITREGVEAPSRVAILIDGLCGSTCEQFVLEARQSDKVRLFGTPTAGVIDYANLLPHELPSGRRLLLPSTRSRRLPGEAVDGIGIAPNFAMDPDQFDGATRGAGLNRALAQLRNALLP